MEGLWGGLVVACIDFLMVFLVLGGLALVIGGLKRVADVLEPQETSEVPPRTKPVHPAAEPSQTDKMPETHIAAILTAIQQFTSLPPGTFTIDSIEPVHAEYVSELTGEQARLRKALIAAITVAIHEYTLMPMGSFQITGLKSLGRVNPWKIAGRLELMGIDAQ